MSNIIKDNVLYAAKSPDTNLKDERSYSYIKTIIHHVNTELRTKGDRDWLVDCETGDKIKLSSIEATTRRVARALAKSGFQYSDIIQMGCCSTLQYYWPVFGAWLCGGVVSVADPTMSEQGMTQQLTDVQPSHVVCQKIFLNKYLNVREQVEKHFKIIVLDGKAEEHFEQHPDVISLQQLVDNVDDNEVDEDVYDVDNVDGNDDAAIFWSSGSTGAPKGIVHSHTNLNRMFQAKVLEFKESILMSNIMFHIGGFCLPSSIGIIGGQKVGFITLFDADEYIKILRRVKPSVLFLGIGHYIKLSSFQAGSETFPYVKRAVPCGGAITPGIHAKMVNLFGPQVKITEAYASTETGVISGVPEDMDKKLGLLGQLHTGVQVYIQDIKTGNKLGPGQEGKLMVKTNNMMKGYLNNPKATKELFDDNGYAFIGDVGYFTQSGDFYFTSRMKNVLKVENFWFGAGEIEQVLEKQQDIKEAIVWGEYDPNKGDDIIHAGLTFVNGHTWTTDKIRELVASLLPSTRRLTGDIFFLKKLPYSLQDKKLRQVMRDWVNKEIYTLTN